MQANKTQAVIYCRIATATTADSFAMENQRQNLYRFAESKGYEITAEYLDKGVSGVTMDRPSFARLNNDMLAGRVSTVLVASGSRIGRETHAVVEWLNNAESLGIDVVSVHDDLSGYKFYSSFISELVKLSKRPRQRTIR